MKPERNSKAGIFRNLSISRKLEAIIMMTVATALVLACLGGRLKTGHTWTLQNRPTERNQNKSIYTLRKGGWQTIFWKAILAGLY